ncbi:hypothetical protein ACO34A_00710 [Rhizobium sp. ACO-34A]|nr:hypothetical protein ACO34A_00710 [Rhizobium sp. ACO-34A]
MHFVFFAAHKLLLCRVPKRDMESARSAPKVTPDVRQAFFQRDCLRHQRHTYVIDSVLRKAKYGMQIRQDMCRVEV